ncbi:MAG: TetR/AcrR family transcriptional regulator [Saprospiraceae bacterium]|nr:TetR/AcrR family transcriptional regulator [Saprospiraceae bacterium]
MRKNSIFESKYAAMLEKTANYILEVVAPIFNRQGYIGTSLSDLTQATQLTKGALYGNFKNKEELALKALELNTRRVLKPLNEQVNRVENHLDKMYAVVHYYRTYYERMQEIGGCPFLNVSIDAKHNNPELFHRVKSLEGRKQQALARILKEGIRREEINGAIDAEVFAKNMYSLIVGAYFMSFVQEDDSYLNTALDQLEYDLLPQLRM